MDGRTMSNFNADVDRNLQRLSEALKAKTLNLCLSEGCTSPEPMAKETAWYPNY